MNFIDFYESICYILIIGLIINIWKLLGLIYFSDEKLKFKEIKVKGYIVINKYRLEFKFFYF